jgi:RNA polymerase sigma-70 factor (ECF subfamily)
MQGVGDKSFEDVALPHLPMVYRVAERLTRNPHAAEDLVQETYLRAYKAFAEFELREFGIIPWLLRILHNTHLNMQARERRIPRARDGQSLDPGQEPEAGNQAVVGTLEIDFEQVDDEVKAAIDALRPEYRAVVLLWATMELSYQEIAEILEVPIGTVMSRLHRARAQLMGALREYAGRQRIAASQKAVE